MNQKTISNTTVAKILQLVNRKKTCKGLVGMQKLLAAEFQSTLRNKSLSYGDDEVTLEDSPYVTFSLNHVLSDDFILCITPTLRNEEFYVNVQVNQMLDGRGMGSQHWKALPEYDEMVIFNDDDSISTCIQLVKDEAISTHARLIESVGVPEKLAIDTARGFYQ